MQMVTNNKMDFFNNLPKDFWTNMAAIIMGIGGGTGAYLARKFGTKVNDRINYTSKEISLLREGYDQEIQEIKELFGNETRALRQEIVALKEDNARGDANYNAIVKIYEASQAQWLAEVTLLKAENYMLKEKIKILIEDNELLKVQVGELKKQSAL